jgi:hypothetical protein
MVMAATVWKAKQSHCADVRKRVSAAVPQVYPVPFALPVGGSVLVV